MRITIYNKPVFATAFEVSAKAWVPRRLRVHFPPHLFAMNEWLDVKDVWLYTWLDSCFVKFSPLRLLYKFSDRTGNICNFSDIRELENKEAMGSKTTILVIIGVVSDKGKPNIYISGPKYLLSSLVVRSMWLLHRQTNILSDVATTFYGVIYYKCRNVQGILDCGLIGSNHFWQIVFSLDCAWL